MERSTSFTLYSCVVLERVHLARSAHAFCLAREYRFNFVFPGPRRPAQADTRVVRTQVHQQVQMREDEGCGKYHSGAQVAGGGALVRALTHLSAI